MKKIFVFSLLIISTLFGYSQSPTYLQNEFFGCKWGWPMSFMKTELEKRGYYTSVGDENILETNNIKFGGYSWRFAEFEYFQDKLYRVSFSNNFETRSEVEDYYRYLSEKLKNKYSEMYINEQRNKDNLGDLYIRDKLNDALFLYCSYSRSNGGDMFYYITLTYIQSELFLKSKANEDDEL